MDEIRRQIRALRCRNTDGKWLIPEGSLVSGLPPEIIQSSIQNHCEVEPYAVQSITQAVETGARKVFAILILIRAEKRITAFLEHHLQSDGQTLDSRLPFSESELENVFAPDVAGEFEEQQWDLIAPVFSQRLLHRNLQNHSRLPFIESRKIGGGGFGDVYEVVILAGHHNFKGIDNTKHARIVRKELRKDLGDDDLWIEVGFNEHQIMSYLHHLEHPNILPLLTSYTYNGIPNFLLPLAEGGDLEQLLNERRRPKDFAEDTRFYSALSGLTSALETLHDYKSGVLGTEMIGYHHDLKPKNVLVSEARFVLSDFGLSKLKTGEDSRTPFKKGQGHYLAPECEDLEDDYSKGVVSRASDVWCLGCIMLEVIVFMVGGTDAVAEFRQNRTIKKGFLTTKTFFCGKSINPEVERKMLELANCEDAVIRRAAALIRQILVVDFRKRLKASEIAVRLRIISFEAYYLKLLAAFQSIRWRIDSLDIITEWNRFRQIAHNLTSEDDVMALNPLDATNLAPFTDRARIENLLASMERQLNYIVCSDLSSDISTEMLLDLRQMNDLLSVRLGDNQRNQGTNSEANHLETDSNQSTSRPVEPECVRNLTCSECILTAATAAVRNAIMSKGEKFLAVECGWQITIYALPSGEQVQEIKMPDELQPFRRAWNGGHPQFIFSPDGKNLVVCWIRHVCSYRVGRDERESWMIFTLLTPGWHTTWRERSESVMMPVPIEVAAISPDSTKVVLDVYRRMNPYSDAWQHLIYIVGLTESEAADAGPIKATVGDVDCVFGFSPDGRQLAISSQRTVRHDKRTAIRIQVLDIVQTGTNQLPLKWFTVYCDESFNEGPRGHYLTILQELFSAGACPRLAFAVWDGRWVAGLWEKSKRALVLHDLHSQNHLASFDLSCLDAFGSGMKNYIFSGNLEFAASCRSPASAIFGKLKRREKKIPDNLIAFANVKTNQVICTLKGVLQDHYWLSESGQYVVVRKKCELRVFDLGIFFGDPI